jgi:hypothetical protein
MNETWLSETSSGNWAWAGDSVGSPIDNKFLKDQGTTSARVVFDKRANRTYWWDPQDPNKACGSQPGDALRVGIEYASPMYKSAMMNIFVNPRMSARSGTQVAVCVGENAGGSTPSMYPEPLGRVNLGSASFDLFGIDPVYYSDDSEFTILVDVLDDGTTIPIRMIARGHDTHSRHDDRIIAAIHYHGWTTSTEAVSADTWAIPDRCKILSCSEAHTTQGSCNADSRCAWCVGGAVPAACNTLSNAEALPTAVFTCDKVHP